MTLETINNLSVSELLAQHLIMNIKPQATFAIIGKGFIFPKHKEAIEQNGGKILDIIDGQDWWGNMIEKTKAEWIVILTPNHTHKQIIDVALKNGKKVICEKPLTLSVKDTKELIGKPVYTIHQLRYLPILVDGDSPARRPNDIKFNISVHRGENYFNSWKGSEYASGGLLFNLGIHYFDLVIHYFGEPTEWKLTKYANERAEGYFSKENYRCDFILDLLAPEDKQERSFTINNMSYDLNTKENLHIRVYQDILAGNGLKPEEALKSIKLIEQLRK